MKKLKAKEVNYLHKVIVSKWQSKDSNLGVLDLEYVLLIISLFIGQRADIRFPSATIFF